jgi:serine/threonine protein kinase
MTGAYGASAGAMPSALPPDWLQHPEKLVGVVLSGRYRITGLLGRGPMGIACEGESSRGRQVTLKLLPKPAELAAERFAWQVRESLAMAHFDHENVIASTDFGALEGGGAFVSRNRFAGVPLRALLMRQGSLPLRRALELGRQVGLGLAAGHAQDIPHGRLKPENLLIQVATQSKPDLIKVVDFGMAQLPVDVRSVVSGENEARRLALRTRIYLPGAHLPGAEGMPPSAAVDVYSLGVLLFEMIAGQAPFVFEAGGWPNLHGGTIDFARCNPQLQVPRAVEEVVLGLLVPNAGVTALEVVAVLESLLGRSSVAPPSAAPEPEMPTAQRPAVAFAASVRSVEPAPATEKGVAPDPRGPSWPSLPPGYPATQPPSGARPPGPPPRDRRPGTLPPGTLPPRMMPPGMPPSGTLSPGTLPPGTLPSGGMRPGTLPPGQQFASVPSFPPAPLLPSPSFAEATLHSMAPPLSPVPPAPGPSASYPPLTLDRSGRPSDPSPFSASADSEGDDETEFRPSLLARLRRMFGRSKPGGEL